MESHTGQAAASARLAAAYGLRSEAIAAVAAAAAKQKAPPTQTIQRLRRTGHAALTTRRRPRFGLREFSAGGMHGLDRADRHTARDKERDPGRQARLQRQAKKHRRPFVAELQSKHCSSIHAPKVVKIETRAWGHPASIGTLLTVWAQTFDLTGNLGVSIPIRGGAARRSDVVQSWQTVLQYVSVAGTAGRHYPAFAQPT